MQISEIFRLCAAPPPAESLRSKTPGKEHSAPTVVFTIALPSRDTLQTRPRLPDMVQLSADSRLFGFSCVAEPYTHLLLSPSSPANPSVHGHNVKKILRNLTQHTSDDFWLCWCTCTSSGHFFVTASSHQFLKAFLLLQLLLPRLEPNRKWGGAVFNAIRLSISIQSRD